MLLENYIDAGLLLVDLMRASTGREITFGKGKVIVRGKSNEPHEAECASNGMTFASIECAIELCKED